MPCRIGPGDEFKCGDVVFVCLERQRTYLMALDPVDRRISKIPIDRAIRKTGARWEHLLVAFGEVRGFLKPGFVISINGLSVKVVRVCPNGNLVCRIGTKEVRIDRWAPLWVRLLPDEAFVGPVKVGQECPPEILPGSGLEGDVVQGAVLEEVAA